MTPQVKYPSYAKKEFQNRFAKPVWILVYTPFVSETFKRLGYSCAVGSSKRGKFLQGRKLPLRIILVVENSETVFKI